MIRWDDYYPVYGSLASASLDGGLVLTVWLSAVIWVVLLIVFISGKPTGAKVFRVTMWMVVAASVIFLVPPVLYLLLFLILWLFAIGAYAFWALALVLMASMAAWNPRTAKLWRLFVARMRKARKPSRRSGTRRFSWSFKTGRGVLGGAAFIAILASCVCWSVWSNVAYSSSNEEAAFARGELGNVPDVSEAIPYIDINASAQALGEYAHCRYSITLSASQAIALLRHVSIPWEETLKGLPLVLPDVHRDVYVQTQEGATVPVRLYFNGDGYVLRSDAGALPDTTLRDFNRNRAHSGRCEMGRFVASS